MNTVLVTAIRQRFGYALNIYDTTQRHIGTTHATNRDDVECTVRDYLHVVYDTHGDSKAADTMRCPYRVIIEYSDALPRKMSYSDAVNVLSSVIRECCVNAANCPHDEENCHTHHPINGLLYVNDVPEDVVMRGIDSASRMIVERLTSYDVVFMRH